MESPSTASETKWRTQGQMEKGLNHGPDRTIFFLLGLYAYLRLPSHTRIPRYKKKEDKRGNVYLKRVEGESMGLRVNPWKNSTLRKRRPKLLRR